MNNPIANAIKAAYRELTTPEAIQWYRDTAHQTWLIVSTVAVLAYCLIETWLLEITELPAEVPLLDAPIAGLLMPAAPLAIYDLRATIAPSGGAPRSCQAHLFYRR